MKHYVYCFFSCSFLVISSLAGMELTDLNKKEVTSSSDQTIITPPLVQKMDYHKPCGKEECLRCLSCTGGAAVCTTGFGSTTAAWLTCPLWCAGTGVGSWILCNGIIAGGILCCVVGAGGVKLMHTACDDYEWQKAYADCKS